MKKNKTGVSVPQARGSQTENSIINESASAKERLQKWLPFVLISLVFMIIYYIFNHTIPLGADDLFFSYVYKGQKAPVADMEPLKHFGEILRIFRPAYMQWSGRVWAGAFIQVFVLAEKWIFNILNSLMLVALGWLIYLHINYGKKANLFLFSLSFIVVWFVPALMESGLWLSGAVSYLWPTVYVLAFLLPCRMAVTGHNEMQDTVMNRVLFAFFGIFAGWSNEHACFGVLAVVLFTILNSYVTDHRVPKWQVAGFLSTATGAAGMLLAPGNRVRLETENGIDLVQYIRFFLRHPVAMMNSRWAMFGGGLVVVTLMTVMILIPLCFIYLFYRRKNREKKTEKKRKAKNEKKSEEWKLFVFYGAMCFLPVAVMLVSPGAGWRLLLYPYVTYAILVILLLHANVEAYKESKKKAKKNNKENSRVFFTKGKAGFLIVLCLGLFSLDVYKEYEILKWNSAQSNQIFMDIQKQVQAGVKDLELTDEKLGYCYKNGHMQSVLCTYTFLLLTDNSADYCNEWIASYTGLDTIIRTGDFSYENWSYFKKE